MNRFGKVIDKYHRFEKCGKRQNKIEKMQSSVCNVSETGYRNIFWETSLHSIHMCITELEYLTIFLIYLHY